MSLSSSTTTTPSDTLMHVVSKSQTLPINQQPDVSMHQESHQALGTTNSQQQQQQQIAHPPPQQLQPATTNAQTSIPQEIATMSESDLISFINPNAFDQGNFI